MDEPPSKKIFSDGSASPLQSSHWQTGNIFFCFAGSVSPVPRPHPNQKKLPDIFPCLKMEECAVLFILRQSVLWERSFFPPERREKLQRLFPGRAENNLFMFVSGKRLKGLCRIVEMGIFPVQQQELWRGLLLLSENIPPDQLIPANFSLTQRTAP